MICVLPRRWAIAPFLLVGILIPIDQVIVAGGLHFLMLRVLVLFGFARMGWAKISGSGKVFSGGMNGIDWAVIIFTVFTLIDGALLWQSQAEVVFQLGNVLSIFGVYFLWRHLIQDQEDVRQVLRSLACLCAIVAGFMAYEYATGHNLIYGVLGGSRAIMAGAADRANGIRAAGPFAHPILAGTFGGFVFPLFVGWWSNDKPRRKWAALGAVGAGAIPFMAGSSTALFALLAGIGALCLWPLRRFMRLLRWGVVATLIAGQMYMTAPVWHIISDVSLSDGSSSYHRYQLVNQCILHFWDWVLVGTKNYASWGWDMWDLSNQYVWAADTAGLIPLIALLAILVYGFKYIGRTRRHFEGDKKQEFFVWAIGASVFANLAAFFGISYFDQTIVPWYALLAMIAAVTAAARKPQEEMATAPATAGMGAKLGGTVPALPATELATAGRALSGRGAQAAVRDRDTPGKSWMLLARNWPRGNE